MVRNGELNHTAIPLRLDVPTDFVYHPLLGQQHLLLFPDGSYKYVNNPKRSIWDVGFEGWQPITDELYTKPENVLGIYLIKD